MTNENAPKHLCAAWDKSLKVEYIGKVWVRKAHMNKSLGILYRRLDKDEGLSVRDEIEFNRLFKEAK